MNFRIGVLTIGFLALLIYAQKSGIATVGPFGLQSGLSIIDERGIDCQNPNMYWLLKLKVKSLIQPFRYHDGAYRKDQFKNTEPSLSTSTIGSVFLMQNLRLPYNSIYTLLRETTQSPNQNELTVWSSDYYREFLRIFTEKYLYPDPRELDRYLQDWNRFYPIGQININWRTTMWRDKISGATNRRF